MSLCIRRGVTYKRHHWKDGFCTRCQLEQFHYVGAEGEGTGIDETDSVDTLIEENLVDAETGPQEDEDVNILG